MHHLTIVGFGSQGAAWSENLRDTGWSVRVLLSREGESWTRAVAAGFQPELLSPAAAAREHGPWVMACPDLEIGNIYRQYLSSVPVRIILIHGYAVFSGDLKVGPNQEVALLAPKAIGPKLRAEFVAGRPHRLAAAITDQPWVRELAAGLGFSEARMIPATFEQETVGDLISEQGLLCGGVFSLLEWTMEEMARAGVPDALIREECLTELELVAGLLRERGPASTFQKISEAAQCGTIAMRAKFMSLGVPLALHAQAEETRSGKFARDLSAGEWRKDRDAFVRRLAVWEKRLK